LASLLQRHRSPEANQTLHDVWPSPIYTYSGANFTLHPSLAFLYIGSVTAQHSGSCVNQTLQCGTNNGMTNFAVWYKQWN